MLYKSILIAGHGGQGILFAGRVIAQAALDAGLNVTYFPSYGAEIRGGTANCSVIISDNDIGSPIVRKWNILILLNRPSFDKFAGNSVENAVLIINSSLVGDIQKIPGREFISVPCTELSNEKFESIKYANIISLGAFIKNSGLIPMKIVEQSLEKMLEDRPKLIQTNIQALHIGADYL